MKSVHFMIERVPVSLNVMLRMHYAQRAKEQAVWDFLIYAQWLASGKIVFNVPVRAIYLISFDSGRQRDYDNYYGGTKFINDALKRSFLTTDDSRILRRIEVEFLQPGKGETIIQIEELNQKEA